MNSYPHIDAKTTRQRWTHLLERALALLGRANEHADAAMGDGWLESRLAPDMFSLAQQVVVLCDSLVGAVALLEAARVPADGEGTAAMSMPLEAGWVFNRGDEASLGPLPRTLDDAIDRLRSANAEIRRLTIEADQRTGPDHRNAIPGDQVITVTRPGHVRQFKASAFVHDYVTPNAYFHLTMIYALLRHAGVPLGKADFEGAASYTVVSTIDR